MIISKTKDIIQEYTGNLDFENDKHLVVIFEACQVKILKELKDNVIMYKLELCQKSIDLLDTLNISLTSKHSCYKPKPTDFIKLSTAENLELSKYFIVQIVLKNTKVGISIKYKLFDHTCSEKAIEPYLNLNYLKNINGYVF